MLKPIKGFIGLTIGAVLGGETIRQVGANISGGIGRATQSLVSVGLVGHASKLFKLK